MNGNITKEKNKIKQYIIVIAIDETVYDKINNNTYIKKFNGVGENIAKIVYKESGNNLVKLLIRLVSDVENLKNLSEIYLTDEVNDNVKIIHWCHTSKDVMEELLKY